MSINRRRLLLAGVGTVAVVSVGSLAALTVRSPNRTSIDTLVYPAFAAHRLGAGIHPENTLTGAQAVMEEFPQALLEFDVQALKDGTFVVFHDETVDRLGATGAHGRVDSMTVAEWQRLRIENPHGRSAAPATFLSELLAQFPNTPMLVELKAHAHRDSFLEVMWDRRDRIILSSFDDTMTSAYTRAGFYALQQVQGTSYPDIIDGVHAVGMDRGRLTYDVIERIHSSGAKAWAWGSDLRKNDPRFVDMGLDGFMVDNPAL